MDDIDEGVAASMANKRPCCSPAMTSLTPENYLPPPELNKESLLDTFVCSSFSLDASLHKILDSKPSDFDKNLFIDRALSRASALADAVNRYARNMASDHNSQLWALPPDLTIKIFSMLDTESLCYVAATCTMFKKCALDPLCYVDIDLRTVVPKVNNVVVSTMIERAGRALRSLKLGIIPGPRTSDGSSQPLVHTIRSSVEPSSFSWNDKRSRQGKEKAILTRSCLNSLIGGSSAPGLLLRRLHLYNIDRMISSALRTALSACPCLLDLEIVGLRVELRHTLESVSTSCQMLERLYFESSKTDKDDSLRASTCADFVNSCPRITSLALRGFKLHDYNVCVIVKGFNKLKHVDFSNSYSVTGSFLEKFGSSDPVMEVLILRDCVHLKEIDVVNFVTSVISGDFKLLKHIDISNNKGLASEDEWYIRCYDPCIPVKQLSEVRPDIRVVAEFPLEGCDLDMIESDDSSDTSSSSEFSSLSGSVIVITSESSDNSDSGGLNEDSEEMHEESSDGVGFLEC